MTRPHFTCLQRHSSSRLPGESGIRRASGSEKPLDRPRATLETERNAILRPSRQMRVTGARPYTCRMAPPTPEEVMGHLERVLASDALSKSGTNRRLLTYLVQRSLQSSDGPKEAEIAMDVFARGATFNGGEDSVVRVSVRGLRQKLVEYYAAKARMTRWRSTSRRAAIGSLYRRASAACRRQPAPRADFPWPTPRKSRSGAGSPLLHADRARPWTRHRGEHSPHCSCCRPPPTSISGDHGLPRIPCARACSRACCGRMSSRARAR